MKRFPAVTKPEGHVHFRTKLTWTVICLVAYFFLSNVIIYGLSPVRLDVFQNFRAILAGTSGSIVHLGIGPIVTGSIIMQLFAGAKIINLDLTDDEDKKIYQGTQKILVVLMIFVEAIPQVFGYLAPSSTFQTMLTPYATGHSVVISILLVILFAAIAVALAEQGTGGAIAGAVLGGLGAFVAFLIGGIPISGFVNNSTHLGTSGIFVAAIVGVVVAIVGGGLVLLRLRATDSEVQGGPAMVALLGVVVGIAVGAILLVYGQQPSNNGLGDLSFGGLGAARFWIVVQLAVGSYLVFLMDEVVSKWGLGSGISLFIAAGVSQSIFTGLVNWLPQASGTPISVSNPPAGVIPKTFYLLTVMTTQQLSTGGFERVVLDAPNPVIALLSTVITFMVVVYAESARIELPLAHGKVRGARGRYPIRLLYASNIPVILAGALLANVSLISILLWSGPLQHMPFIGHKEWVGGYTIQNGQYTTTPYSGIAYYFNSMQGVQDWLLPFLSANRRIPYLSGGIFHYIGIADGNVQVLTHFLLWAIFMIGGSVLFAIFWIETTNMGPDQVADQIQKSGMQIPGFRRDPRVTGKILARYIPVVTVIGGASIGALAVFADMLGTLGNASGTGILLTVGILQRLYEQIAKEQAMEMHPLLRGFFGEG
ncbi:MAG: preprotein translocase subunit SecY [Thermoplasmatota archaeon]